VAQNTGQRNAPKTGSNDDDLKWKSCTLTIFRRATIKASNSTTSTSTIGGRSICLSGGRLSQSQMRVPEQSLDRE
jgi:hypothetical protein